MSILKFITRNYKAVYPPETPKEPGALRCGILGAARIAPAAIITPAKTHPEFIIYAVAARDEAKATAFAKKHGIPKTYSGPTGYQDMLDDKDIDVVYNPLPNGLHYEWTMKALAAGKHVLLEKPCSDTAEEAKSMFEYAERKGLVLLEAFHSRFHPAINRMRDILSSGELGKIKAVEANLCVPKWTLNFSEDDIRFNFALGGGIMMDMGCYVMMASRYVTGLNPTEVISATAEPFPGSEEQKAKIDIGTKATLVFPQDIIAEINCHARYAGWGPFGLLPSMPKLNVTAICEGGKVELTNFTMPHMMHEIIVTPKSGKKRSETAFTFKDGKEGEDWWTSYRYQLENFVDKVKGREPRLWMSGEDSIANMLWIEKVYEKTGMGSRPTSAFLTNGEVTGLVMN